MYNMPIQYIGIVCAGGQELLLIAENVVLLILVLFQILISLIALHIVCPIELGLGISAHIVQIVLVWLRKLIYYPFFM